MVDDLIPLQEEAHLRFRSAEPRLVLMLQTRDGTEQGPLNTGRQASRGPRDGSWEVFPGLRHGGMACQDPPSLCFWQPSSDSV